MAQKGGVFLEQIFSSIERCKRLMGFIMKWNIINN